MLAPRHSLIQDSTPAPTAAQAAFKAVLSDPITRKEYGVTLPALDGLYHEGKITLPEYHAAMRLGIERTEGKRRLCGWQTGEALYHLYRTRGFRAYGDYSTLGAFLAAGEWRVGESQGYKLMGNYAFYLTDHALSGFRGDAYGLGISEVDGELWRMLHAASPTRLYRMRQFVVSETPNPDLSSPDASPFAGHVWDCTMYADTQNMSDDDFKVSVLGLAPIAATTTRYEARETYAQDAVGTLQRLIAEMGLKEFDQIEITIRRLD